MRRPVSLITAMSLLAGCALASEAGKSCRTSHNLVGACFAVHGRLFEAEGTPYIHIDETGSKQVFGVLDRQSQAKSAELIPATVNAMLVPAPFSTAIYGDYEICPFEKDTTGAIRAVCIQSASHLSARHR